MTYFLRNNNNQTIVDVEVTDADLHVVIDVATYSKFLLDNYYRADIITDFSALQELRGDWFEIERDKGVSIKKFAESRLKEIGRKYGLYFVVD